MTTCIAFLRGINVGKAKRIAMAELRELVEAIGASNVRTLLNSGNVVFDAARADRKKLAGAIESAIQAKFGFAARVAVITAADLDAIVSGNPIARATKEPAKFLVAVAASDAVLAKAKPLTSQKWAPEALAIAGHAAYLYCATGLIESKLWKAFERATAGEATARNWTTMLKLQANVAK